MFERYSLIKVVWTDIDSHNMCVIMKVVFFTTAGGRKPIKDYISQLATTEHSACLSVLSALSSNNFDVPPKYLKKMRGYKKLWELRVISKQQHRFLFTTVLDSIVILHAFTKKTMKTPIREIQVALHRQRIYGNY